MLSGSHEDLLLDYRLEKRDFYAHGDNLFYARLKENDMWWFESETFRQEAISCFHCQDDYSTYLVRLFTTYLDFTPNFDAGRLVVSFGDIESPPSFYQEKMLKKSAEIILQNCSNEGKVLELLNDFICNCNERHGGRHYLDEETVFEFAMYLQTITVALKYKKYDAGRLHVLIEKCLPFIENIIINRQSEEDYKRTKIFELAINVGIHLHFQTLISL